MVGGWVCHRCTRRGACLLCRLPAPPLACFPAPYPPDPLPLRGRGRPRLFHARGFAPCIPGLNPSGTYRARQAGALRRGEPAVRRKSDRTPFLRAVPAAKERGDRGRGTSAFEMVLSPGAGIASAAGNSTLRARAGGIGAVKQAKGRGGRQPKRQATRRTPQRQSRAGNKKPPARAKIFRNPLTNAKNVV